MRSCFLGLPDGKFKAAWNSAQVVSPQGNASALDIVSHTRHAHAFIVGIRSDRLPAHVLSQAMKPQSLLGTGSQAGIYYKGMSSPPGTTLLQGDMMTMFSWICWLVSVHTVAGMFPVKPSNRGLSFIPPSGTYHDRLDNIPRILSHCPEQFHGCSRELTSHSDDKYVVTCSCAQNCRVNGDCCWNVLFTTQMAKTSETSCIGVQISQKAKIHVNMVIGCPEAWPIDDVRLACERPEFFADRFNVIPATTVTGVTYRPAVFASKMPYRHLQAPSLSVLLKPVLKTPTCHAKYDGRCYIRRSRHVSYAHRSSEVQFDTKGNGRPAKLRHSQARYRTEWQSNYSLRNCIALACTALSICFLILKLIVFCVFKEARRSSSSCTICMAGTLLVAQVMLLITKCADLEEHVCFAGAVFGHYTFLSTFMWTCVLSFDIWKSLTTVQTSSTNGNTLAWYSLLAWGAPLLVVSGAVVVDQTAPDSVLSPDYGDPICFISSFWGLVVYFFVPMASLVLFCLVLYFHTVCYIRATSSAVQGGHDVQKPGRWSRPKCGPQKNNLTLFVRLSLVMGLPWAVTLVGSFVPNRIVDSVVDVIVGSQGVYLFFIFKDYSYIWASIRKKVADRAPSVASITVDSRGN
ncbi:hypothetical protein HPB51_011875 [Rhipicephalus microplus]|uniref:G-protein coupled receptors family 2 profile 2 domain-containing protein n=1 Tax=Rhipicephalus microplus TaxID=6941 RepID=A0A9J6E947_RHIMP|nr:hypothetical protein HPB51_011875 [Rhipicephalus microplus]